MSQFRYPKPQSSPASAVSFAAENGAATSVAPPPSQPAPSVPARVSAAAAEKALLKREKSSFAVTTKIGLWGLGLYLISGYANDISLHVLGAKTYLSWISGWMIVLAFITCGNAARGLSTKAGRLWTLLAFTMCVSAVFGLWASGSFTMVKSYVTRGLGCFFYVCAFVHTRKHCQFLINANVLSGFGLLAACVLLGAPQEGTGRFVLADSIFFSNPNDLALGLLCTLPFFLYLCLQKKMLIAATGGAAFGMTIYFILKTASRGCFLGLAAFILLTLVFSDRRAKLIGFLVPTLLVGAIFLPKSAFNRMTFIVADPGSSVTLEEGVTGGDVASQFQRQLLVKKSIWIAITHPLLGVGPDNFQQELYNEDKTFGTHQAALGTHNSYTQIASECGIPAFLMYVALIVMTARSSFKLWRSTRGKLGLEQISIAAFCMFIGIIAYSVASAFHHVAYGSAIPLSSGIVAVLRMAAEPLLAPAPVSAA